MLSMTPRELSIMLAAQRERQYDEMELMAIQAMMIRQAYHAKRLKQSDLFRRPVDEEKARSKADEIQERTKKRMEWLSQFEEFRGKINVREEETNG